MNFVCVVEYDGTDFCGWQFQPRLRTVQGEIEKALRKMAKEDIPVTAAGRTDSGVHAAGQVINMRILREWSPATVRNGLNALLPPDILIRSCRIADDRFHARFDARSREYRYLIYNGRSSLKRRDHWCTDQCLELPVLERLASAVSGKHDFSSFCVKKSQKESNSCVVMKSCWTKRGRVYTFRVVADRFLHGMVRSLVGTMTRVSAGQLTDREFSRLFTKPQRSSVTMAAPPQGLCLMKVNY